MSQRKSRKVADSYFEEPPQVQEEGVNFTDMNISRPILKVRVHYNYTSMGSTRISEDTRYLRSLDTLVTVLTCC